MCIRDRGITVLADRPFQVGDWIVVGDVEGTVEKVGFRSMRVRTFKDSLITVPNGQLTDHVVDNMGVRAFRRYDTTLRLPLSSTPDQVQAFCEGVRALLHANERCLLYTSDAADERSSVDLGGRRIIEKKNKTQRDAIEL